MIRSISGADATAGDSDDEFSHAAKRQRLSSPTYDEQFELGQDEVAAFDAFERTLSQTTVTAVPTKTTTASLKSFSQPRLSHLVTDSARKRRHSAIALALGSQDDSNVLIGEDDPIRKPLFKDGKNHEQTTTQVRSSGFMSAKHISCASQVCESHSHPPSSQDGPDDLEIANWFQSAGAPTSGLMFRSAKEMEEQPHEDDDGFFHEWLNAPAPAGAVGFQTAKSINLISEPEFSVHSQASTSNAAPKLPGFVSGARLQTQSHVEPSSTDASSPNLAPAVAGFTSCAALVNPNAKKSSWAAPSAAALAAAAAKMKQWEREMESDVSMDVDVDHQPEGESVDASVDVDSPLKSRSNNHQPAVSWPSFGNARSVLAAMENSSVLAPASQQSDIDLNSQPPETPTPGARTFGPPSMPNFKGGTQGGAKPFKSPLLLNKPASTGSHGPSRLNLNVPASMGFVTPLKKTTGFTTPSRTISEPGLSSSFISPLSMTSSATLSGFSTPNKPSGAAHRGKTGFVTPFKPGFRPGEPGRILLDAQARPSSGASVVSVTPPGSSGGKGKGRASYFDLTKPKGRETLQSCGLRPQKYTTEQLERMGINVSELSQMTPDMAMYYTFHTTSVAPTQKPSSAVATRLGPKAALDELKRRGCRLATKKWVENHWGLILWKLAGMVCLDPDAESDLARRRWCWREVINQLLYRYEREINRGQRPPLRKIVAQDVSPSAPMVLCVSNLTWTKESIDEDGSPLPPVPELEVTDGWYRLDAQIDDPIERAIRKGKIRVGTKIAVAGCHIQLERKEGGEILEVGQSAMLQVYGNSCHLAPWHAKLGFQREPFTWALNSLDPYGGSVHAIEVVILKAYPIAYLEFFTSDDGRKWQEGPYNDKEEAKLHEDWQAKRETEAAKLREEYGGNLRKFTEYAEQLERRAGSDFHPGEDDLPPDCTDDLLLELEDTEDGRELIRELTPNEAGWLAQAARHKCIRDAELMGEYIERDLNIACPPRNVRSFRIVVGRDARAEKRPAQREVQITVWDVLSVQLEEDGERGEFVKGQHVRATNLHPSKVGCWMPPGDQSVIYLASRKESVWTLLGKGVEIR